MDTIEVENTVAIERKCCFLGRPILGEIPNLRMSAWYDAVSFVRGTMQFQKKDGLMICNVILSSAALDVSASMIAVKFFVAQDRNLNMLYVNLSAFEVPVWLQIIAHSPTSF